MSHGSGRNLFGNKVEKKFGIKEKSLYLCIMKKEKLIHSVSSHLRDKSHEMRIIQNENNVKLKMTYEAYNANERFTGEQFINGKWEHTFDILDLGVLPDKTMYVSSEGKREDKAEKLFGLGTKLFNILNQ